MNTIYVTYRQNGSLKRGVLSQTQYQKYSQDPTISDLRNYINQSSMEQAFNEAKGIVEKNKSILLG